ncbi:4'-phosphopantetheinyl transferase superfamily protein [Candidatus Woesearchaeota archaeon]|nr:4'-phosphopantetheinyl transferase superfamily protein [Candidatus Woesearchaeota archaeon]
MSIRTGIDLAYVPAVRKMLGNDKTLSKFFHQSELKNDPQHMAGIIAAKEAFFKALGIVPKFLEVEVVHDTSGKPKIKASPQLKKYKSCDVSISHERSYAVAVVVMVK